MKRKSSGTLPVTIWMNMPSFYQDDLFRALSRSDEVDVFVVYGGEVPRDRKELGWEAPGREYPSVILAGWNSALRALTMAFLQRNRVHVFGGIWAVPKFAVVLAVLGLLGSKVVVLSEAPELSVPRRGILQRLKRLFGKWVASRPESYLLPISHFATNFYQDLGFSDTKTYPFLYVSKEDPDAVQVQRADSEIFKIIFVGQLIRRKGVDLVLRALEPIISSGRNVEFEIVGNGDQESALILLAEELGIRDHLHFHGCVDSSKVISVIAEAHVLVLPARWDGWGLVVNEALSVETPVIVSDQCGAADIVRPGFNGYVFESENHEDLRIRIETLMDKSKSVDFASGARWTYHSISQASLVPYLINILRHIGGHTDEKPIPPWES